VPRLVSLGEASYRKMILNLWWAAEYNVVAIPLALGVREAWNLADPGGGGHIQVRGIRRAGRTPQKLRKDRLELASCAIPP
jgi:hypothetical protein